MPQDVTDFPDFRVVDFVDPPCRGLQIAFWRQECAGLCSGRAEMAALIDIASEAGVMTVVSWWRGRFPEESLQEGFQTAFQSHEFGCPRGTSLRMKVGRTGQY